MHPSPWHWRAAQGPVSLGSLEQAQALAHLRAPPRHPDAGATLAGLPNPTRVAAGPGSASCRSLSAASPEQGFLLPTVIFSGALLWLQKLAVWQELPFTLWGLSKVQRRKCQQRGKGVHCAPDLPVPGTMQPIKIPFLFIQPSLPAFRPGRIKFPYPTLLSRKTCFSPCPVEHNEEGHAPAEGDPPPQHRCRQIRFLPRQDGVPLARLGVVALRPCSAWRREAGLMSQAGVCCASPCQWKEEVCWCKTSP